MSGHRGRLPTVIPRYFVSIAAGVVRRDTRIAAILRTKQKPPLYVGAAD